MLLQKDDVTSFMKPIYFASKTMIGSEKNYTDVEKMMFALIFVVRRFRPYLLSRSFVVLTIDHCFPFIVQHWHLSPHVSKWILELQEFEYSFTVEESTRASLADILTFKRREKKITPGQSHREVEEDSFVQIEDAFTLFFDGACRKKTGLVGGGIIILNPKKEVVIKEGQIFQDVYSNNEAEYAALKLGLEVCLEAWGKKSGCERGCPSHYKTTQGSMVFCKSESLLKWLKQVKSILKKFEKTQIQHVPREINKEADALANDQMETVVVGVIKFQEPKMEGCDALQDIRYFFLMGECPKHLDKVQKHRLVSRALPYQLLGEELYKREGFSAKEGTR